MIRQHKADGQTNRDINVVINVVIITAIVIVVIDVFVVIYASTGIIFISWMSPTSKSRYHFDSTFIFIVITVIIIIVVIVVIVVVIIIHMIVIVFGRFCVCRRQDFIVL